MTIFYNPKFSAYGRWLNKRFWKTHGTQMSILDVTRRDPKKRQSLFAFGLEKITREHVYMKNREKTVYNVHPDSIHYTMVGQGVWIAR